jgi:hypothetical protein
MAALYGVATARSNEAVKRNYGRFPEDFVFRLCVAEQARSRRVPEIGAWAFTSTARSKLRTY